MYEHLFQSPDRPFRATPDVKFYYAHESVETARQTVVRAVVRAEGPVMVLGGAGLGKSLLGLLLAGELSPRFDIVKLHAARLCSRRALLQNILFELQLPYRDLSEGELRLSILDRLEPSPKHAPEGILILVDEAHTLPSKLLDELRLITNFTRNNQPRARLVLIGSLRLEDTFAEPQMESFNQRLAARCYLTPMNRQQTRDFVRHQLSAAGVVPHEFITDSALDTVYAASEGVPRLSNQIMDHAMVLAITRNQCPVSSALIEEAWADLQQLPAPWHAGADKHDTTPAAIEFGTLDESEPAVLGKATDELNYFEFSSSTTTLATDEQEELSGESFEDREWTAHEPQTELKLEPTALAAGNETEPTAAGAHDFSPSDSIEAVSELSLDLEEDEELLETFAEVDETHENNFFAAFAPPDQELAELERGENDRDADEADLVRPIVDFDPKLASAGKEDHVDDDSKAGPLKIDSYFANRPTDEKLLALEDEQAQYDSMGVWENDPPLGEPFSHATPLPQILDGDGEIEVELTAPVASSENPASPPLATTSKQQLFGDDFDDEVLIADNAPGNLLRSEWKSEGAPQRSVNEPLPVDFPSAHANQVKPIQSTADISPRIEEDQPSLGILRATTFHEPRILDDIVHELLSTDVIAADSETDPTEDTQPQAWSVDISAVDVKSEMAVHSEIEDLVSQLNFSAFSVEPYSVEQISIEPSDQRHQPPLDSVRTGDKDEIYTLHRAQDLAEERFFSELTATYDDDRNMLVIEEDLPAQPLENEAHESGTPPLKIAPYSQLFAKLRK